MTDPAIVSLVKDTWTAVATNVYGVMVHVIKIGVDATTGQPAKLYITEVDAGTAPTVAYRDARQIYIDNDGFAMGSWDTLKDIHVIARDSTADIRVSV